MEKTTKFEQDLKQYFPDIYKLHQLGKFDKKLWIAINKMIAQYDNRLYGEIKISYQDGKINFVTVSIRE